MLPSAITHTRAIASVVVTRALIFVFPLCDLTPRIRYFLRARGATNGFRWRNGAVPNRATVPGGWKTTIICLCRIYLRAVSPFSVARGVRLADHRLTARPSRTPRHREQ